MTFEQVSAMLAEIGPALDVAEIGAMAEDETWLIAVDDETEQSMVLTRDASTGKLFISTHLGAPPREQLPRACEFALAYNLTWSETDGARLGREPELGEFVLLHDIVLHDLTAEALRTVLANFLKVSVGLRAVIATGFGDGDAEANAPDPSADAHHAIRV